MRCGRCGALLTVGGERLGEVDDRLRLESYAWATDDYVKCWVCGWHYKPTMRPSDRPKLKFARMKSLSRDSYDVYASRGQPNEMARLLRMKARGRYIDKDLRR